jgi:biotin carboxyl carrier protein
LHTVQLLIEELGGSDVAEFELAQRDFRLRVRRRLTAHAFPAVERTSSEPRGAPVVAPLTGIFYRAPTPTAEPYVHEGDLVDVGATIGLIETMKIFNEVIVEQSGRVERLLAQNGQLVHAGDLLLTLAPAERGDAVPLTA